MLLDVKNLSIKFETARGILHAVRDVSFQVNEGETLGIVGESGCGKSITTMALMGLLPKNAQITSDHIKFQGQDISQYSEAKLRKIRGDNMTIIFQDPMTSLNPSFTVGQQIIETIKIHQGGTKNELVQKALALLEVVGIPSPHKRFHNYPHELSGGMCQRVMIAMSIACDPKLLIADEPTTALDVTIQSQILELLMKLKEDHKMGLIFITHDIGVVANISDRIQVMYAGEVIETGVTSDVINSPLHPYTEALFKSLPMMQKSGHKEKLYSLPGLVPDLIHRPDGCQLRPRCPYAKDNCEQEILFDEFDNNRKVKCLYPLKQGGQNE